MTLKVHVSDTEMIIMIRLTQSLILSLLVVAVVYRIDCVVNLVWLKQKTE